MVTGSLRFTCRRDGDFRVDGDAATLIERRNAVAPGAWTWLRQVHGADVVVVTEPGEHAGATADAAVTDHPDAVLAVHTADCVPVLLAGDDGRVVGAAHAGWNGLVGGVLERTVEAMCDLGARGIGATVGPHIRARCYEFGDDDLAVVADACSDAVRSTTAWGTPALDLLAGIRVSLARSNVDDVTVEAGCTACEPNRFYSHRARGDAGRHAAVIRPRLARPAGRVG